MEFSQKMQTCLKNGVKVYPIWKRGFAYIQVEINNSKKTFDKPLNGSKEINNAMTKTYEYYYNKLTNNI